VISEANQKAIEAAGLSFILGMKITDVPYQVAQWRKEHPGEDIPDRPSPPPTASPTTSARPSTPLSAQLTCAPRMGQLGFYRPLWDCHDNYLTCPSRLPDKCDEPFRSSGSALWQRQSPP
jgi:hypothetical protein